MPIVGLKQIGAKRGRQYSCAKGHAHLKRQRRHRRLSLNFTVPLFKGRDRVPQLLIVSGCYRLEYLRAVMRKGSQANGVDIALNLTKVIWRQLRLLRQEVEDSTCAIWLGPMMSQEVWIVCADYALICSDDNSRRRIINMRQFVEGNPAGPFARVRRSIIRDAAITAPANWTFASSVITDVSVNVGIYKVLRGTAVDAQRGSKVCP